MQQNAPRFMPIQAQQPVFKIGKLRSIGGCMNDDVLVEAIDEAEGRPVKLNKMTVVAFSELDDGRFMLWTSGGFRFITKTDDFKREKEDGDEDKNLEVGKSGTPPSS